MGSCPVFWILGAAAQRKSFELDKPGKVTTIIMTQNQQIVSRLLYLPFLLH